MPHSEWTCTQTYPAKPKTRAVKPPICARDQLARPEASDLATWSGQAALFAWQLQKE